MKKKLFLALLTTLLILLAASAALAVSPSDFNCIKCGEPCTEWYASISNDGTTNNHSPLCRTCWAIVWYVHFPCTPVEGTATCIQADLCSVCGYPDNINSAPNPNAHNMRSWSIYSSTQHHRYCQNCYAKDTYEYEDHYGSPATCIAPAFCEGCRTSYGDLAADAHMWREWIPGASGTHYRTCSLNAKHIEYGVCSGEWFWLGDKYHGMVCDQCGEHQVAEHSGGTATCSQPAICDICSEPYGELAPAAHDWGDWVSDGNGQHTRTCRHDASHTESQDCSGGTATCSQPAICEVCSEPYGEPDSSGLTGHPDPTIEEKPSTCYDEGYYRITCDEPGCSMPFYEVSTPANGQHIYNNWQPTGDGSHVSACHYCGEALTVPCTIFTAELFAACPICGEYEGGVLLVVYAHDDDESLPYGTLVIRGGEIPVDGALYAITVAGSYGGQVVELIAPVTVSVPVNATGFRVVDMNVEEIPFTLEDGALTFETAQAGLFLLIPAE